MLEALRPIQAPAPVIPPIVIPFVDDQKQEAGPMRIVAPADALIEPEGPMIDKRPVSPQHSASASSSVEIPGAPRYTFLYLNGLKIKTGEPSLREIAQRMKIPLPANVLKSEIIQAIMNETRPRPRPKIAPREKTM
jgi:hypothetical protein